MNGSQTKPVLLLFNSSYFTKRKVYFKFGNVSVIAIFVPVFSPAMGQTCSVNTSVAHGWAHVCSFLQKRDGWNTVPTSSLSPCELPPMQGAEIMICS